MVIKMTAKEYEKKYGQAPVVIGGSSTTKNQAPVQQSQGIGSQVKSAFQSGIQQIKTGFGQAQLGNSPTQAFQGATNIAAGAINTAAAPLAPAFNATIGKGVDYAQKKLANTYGENIERGLYEGGTTQAEKTLETTGNLSTIAGAVAGFKGGAPAVKTVAKGASEAIAPIARTAGKTLKSAGESAYAITAPPSEAMAQRILKYDAKQPNLTGRIKNFINDAEVGNRPITEANTVARKGLVGTEYQLGVQAEKIAPTLYKDIIQPQLQKVKKVTDMKSFVSSVEKEIISSVKDQTRRKALLEAVKSVREDYKHSSAKINLETLQDLKSEWAEFIPDATYAGKPIAASLKEVHNLMADKARKVILNNVDENARIAYIDYGNLQSIIKSGVKSITGDAAKKSLSRNAWEFVMDKAVTPIATIAGKILYKTGEGLEFVGKKGAKTVKEALD
jgi:hypothetical protein